tara:strand:+ start:167 stop:925 length:759 start_codon:yes stop_codon:yes gene_type:complete
MEQTNDLDFHKLVSNLNEDDPISEDNITTSEQISCDFCKFVTNAKGKDHPRAIRNHIRKKHPVEFAEIFGKEVPKAKEPKFNIEYASPALEEIKDFVEGNKDDDVREQLLNDLDLLQAKFSDKIVFKWDYSAGSSLQHLRRKKALFLRLLNDEAGISACFKLLTIGCSGIERLTSSTGVADIGGFSSDISEQRDEIVPILKNLVDTGQISVASLSPEMRLMMIMSSTAIERLEKNRIARSVPLNEQEEDGWQ